MVWDPQKPKLSLLDPPMDPIWAHFVDILGKFGVKKRVFHKKVFLTQNHFLLVPRLSGTLKKPKISLLDPPMDPILAHFVCKKADFVVKIAFFSNMHFRTK